MPDELMSFEYWQRATWKGYLSHRSSQLQSVDTALSAYHRSPSDAAKDRVLGALTAWIQKEGANWKRNPRNHTHAIEDLYEQLTAPATGLTPAELGAEWEAQYEQLAILERFRNQKLEWRSGYLGKIANNKFGFHLNLVSGGRNVQVLSPHSGTSSDTASTIAAKVLDALIPPELRAPVMVALESVIPDFTTKLAESMAPFVGVIVAGAGTLWNLKGLIRAEYRAETSRTHTDRALNFGTPHAAMEAIVRVLERERNAEAFSFSVSLGEFASKIGGALVDAGTATTAALGLAANVAKLTNIVRIIVRDVQEKNAGNELMKRSLNMTVFEQCPIVGAYYVCCAPHSVLVNQILERWSHGGWKEEALFNIREHIEPMREQGRRLIREHRFVMPIFLSYPGVLAPNLAAIEAMKKRAAANLAKGMRPPLTRQNASLNLRPGVPPRPSLQRQNASLDLKRH